MNRLLVVLYFFVPLTTKDTVQGLVSRKQSFFRTETLSYFVGTRPDVPGVLKSTCYRQDL